MNDFDLDQLNIVRLRDAPLFNGDLLQFRGNGFISSLIRYATHGVHTHSAMLRVQGRDEDVMEIREFKGGRMVPLAGQVERHPGRIDVFRARQSVFDYDVDRAVAVMRLLTQRDYGYRGIARLIAQRLPVMWRFCRLDTRDACLSDMSPVTSAPFCSHAIAIACGRGGVDPVPRKPDDLVTPADLTWSLLFDYVCTLTP